MMVKEGKHVPLWSANDWSPAQRSNNLSQPLKEAISLKRLENNAQPEKPKPDNILQQQT